MCIIIYILNKNLSKTCNLPIFLSCNSCLKTENDTVGACLGFLSFAEKLPVKVSRFVTVNEGQEQKNPRRVK